MPINGTVEDFIIEQEEKQLSFEDVQSKVSSEVQDVTIHEIGLYHHPTVMLRDSELNRLNKYLESGGSYEEYSPLGTFEYDSIEFATVPARVSLLSFVLSDFAAFSVEEYHTWMSENKVPDEALETYKDWCTQEKYGGVNEIYYADSDVIWDLSRTDIYSEGVITPLLSVAILFEDESGVFYTGVYPVDIQEDETKKLFDIALEEDIVTDEDDESTEESQDETVEYNTVETNATALGKTININDMVIKFETIFESDWYTVPILDHAFDSISKESYELIQSLENGLYKTTVDVDINQIPNKSTLNIETPYDTLSLPWEPSLKNGNITKELLKNEDELEDGFEIYLRSPYTAMEENIGNVYATSRNYVWVAIPPEKIKEDDENKSNKIAQESENKKANKDGNSSNQTEEDSETQTEEPPINDTRGILERIGIR